MNHSQSRERPDLQRLPVEHRETLPSMSVHAGKRVASVSFLTPEDDDHKAQRRNSGTPSPLAETIVYQESIRYAGSLQSP
jgi:hypothetical protein